MFNKPHEIKNFTELCPWCKSNEFTLYVEARDWRHSIPGNYNLYSCARCGLIMQIPFPSWEKISTYYPGNYVSFQNTNREEDWFSYTIKRLGYKERISLVNEYTDTGEWMDVGCGTGEFLEYLQHVKKWNLYGVEPIKEAVQIAEERTNLPIINTTFENLSGFEDISFDVITMWEVIEHLYNPISALEKASKLLKPGGILVMSTPNLSALDRLLFGKYWAGYDLPRHLFLFSTLTLENICNSFKLTCVKRTSLGGSFTAFMIGLTSWNTKVGNRCLHKLLSLRFLRYLMQIVTFVPRKIAHHLNLGTSITLVFEKYE